MWQGQALGSAAHMTSLRRTRIGSYRVGDAWSMPDLAAAIGGKPRSAAEAQNGGQAPVKDGGADGVEGPRSEETGTEEEAGRSEEAAVDQEPEPKRPRLDA